MFIPRCPSPVRGTVTSSTRRPQRRPAALRPRSSQWHRRTSVQEDVNDVLGELANIIGGNVKAMLPAGCFLSLPQVVLAPASATTYPSAVQVCGLHGTWHGEPVSITVWQSRNDVKKEDAPS